MNIFFYRIDINGQSDGEAAPYGSILYTHEKNGLLLYRLLTSNTLVLRIMNSEFFLPSFFNNKWNNLIIQKYNQLDGETGYEKTIIKLYKNGFPIKLNN